MAYKASRQYTPRESTSFSTSMRRQFASVNTTHSPIHSQRRDMKSDHNRVNTTKGIAKKIAQDCIKTFVKDRADAVKVLNSHFDIHDMSIMSNVLEKLVGYYAHELLFAIMPRFENKQIREPDGYPIQHWVAWNMNNSEPIEGFSEFRKHDDISQTCRWLLGMKFSPFAYNKKEEILFDSMNTAIKSNTDGKKGPVKKWLDDAEYKIILKEMYHNHSPDILRKCAISFFNTLSDKKIDKLRPALYWILSFDDTMSLIVNTLFDSLFRLRPESKKSSMYDQVRTMIRNVLHILKVDPDRDTMKGCFPRVPKSCDVLRAEFLRCIEDYIFSTDIIAFAQTAGEKPIDIFGSVLGECLMNDENLHIEKCASLIDNWLFDSTDLSVSVPCVLTFIGHISGAKMCASNLLIHSIIKAFGAGTFGKGAIGSEINILSLIETKSLEDFVQQPRRGYRNIMRHSSVPSVDYTLLQNAHAKMSEIKVRLTEERKTKSKFDRETYADSIDELIDDIDVRCLKCEFSPEKVDVYAKSIIEHSQKIGDQVLFASAYIIKVLSEISGKEDMRNAQMKFVASIIKKAQIGDSFIDAFSCLEKIDLSPFDECNTMADYMTDLKKSVTCS